NVGFNGGIDLTDKFNVGVAANYVSTSCVGRNETGYNNNIMSMFRQWWETNVNVADMEEIYNDTKKNYGWNPASSSDPAVPIFWDNPYFQRFESFESDKRDRLYGNVTLNYKVNNIISILGRAAVDQYGYVQEERVAMGSVPKRFGIGGADAGSGYSRLNKNFRETNFDLMVNLKKDLNEKFSLTGLLGTNIRRTYSNTIFASTNGGLVIPKFYSISNSKEVPNASVESEEAIGVNGFFGSGSLGYKHFLYLDVTARQDYSSTLPASKNHFFYPGISASFVFSEKLKNLTWLDFGKVRVNYAKVGNDAPFASVSNTYTKPISFGSTPLFSLPITRNNPELEAELSSTAEAGLEMIFFKKRLGFDFTVYNKKTEKQIVPVTVSTATGYSSKFVNAGVIQNRGIEISLYGTPVQRKKFSWTVQVNFGKNKNKVLELYEGVKNLQISSFQGGVTLNATLDESYGSLKGTDYVYLNGQKVVGADGYYKKTTTTDNVIGNINPDFNMGITNTFTYKNWAMSFLVDMQKGGDIFSLDLYYGLATGLYEETAGNNDLGNPVRNTLAQGGGVILDGVTADGKTNTKRVAGDDYRLNGYAKNPDKAFIYDASYVKLREVVISYRIPFKSESFFSNASIGIVGNNLWIIFKNLPYADPETGLSSGNVQGYQTGVLPTTRNFGLNLKLQF
nr:TonB-dependent receptor [Bacteroidota bacterium]